MWARFRSFACATALVAVSLNPRGADAFVRGVATDTQNPDALTPPLSWSTSCEPANIYLNGFTEMTPDEVAKSIAAAAAAWGPDQVNCSSSTGDAGRGHPYFEIISQFATGSPPAPAPDGNNTIVFQTKSWDQSPDALAYAKPWYQPSGDIIDVDIEINAVPGRGYVLANLDPGSPLEQHDQTQFDLQALMTHEFGHFLGLAHTCMGEGYGMGSDDSNEPPPGSTDSYGQPIPTCTQGPPDAEAVQAAAVMWYTVDPGVIAKRILTADDARGVCAVYSPAAPNIPACAQNSPDDGCNCDAFGQGPRSLVAPGLVALALLVGTRRRREA